MPDLVIIKRGRFWRAAPESYGEARSIGWAPSGRFESFGTPPVTGQALARVLVRAAHAGLTVRPVIETE